MKSPIHTLLAILIVAWLQGCKTREVVLEGQVPDSPGVPFTEGPVWNVDGSVYFSDCGNQRIMRLVRGQVQVARDASNGANGLLMDRQGRLMACEFKSRRVTRTEPSGLVTVLTDQYQGKRYNSPNDLTIDTKGRVYFTDPRYGKRDDIEQVDEQGKPIEGVYRIDPDGKVTRLIAHEVDRPNGIAISPDEKFLYVADNVNDGPNGGVGGARKLWRFVLRTDGSIDLASRKLLFDWGTERGPDGMAVDVNGTLYVAAGFNKPNPPAETAAVHKAGVYVITPEGKLVDFIPVPEDMCTNCAFGGPALHTLYITAGRSLYSVELPVRGYVPGER